MEEKTIICLSIDCDFSCRITTTTSVDFGTEVCCPFYQRIKDKKGVSIKIPYETKTEPEQERKS
jgi:hypothetical protein